jgi:hypothetical protein
MGGMRQPYFFYISFFFKINLNMDYNKIWLGKRSDAGLIVDVRGDPLEDCGR